MVSGREFNSRPRFCSNLVAGGSNPDTDIIYLMQVNRLTSSIILAGDLIDRVRTKNLAGSRIRPK